MSDVKCPRCGKEQDINHDDGYGYADGETFEQECVSCDEPFEYETTITVSHDVYCKNHEDHDFEQPPKGLKLWYCAKCDFYEIRENMGDGK